MDDYVEALLNQYYHVVGQEKEEQFDFLKEFFRKNMENLSKIEQTEERHEEMDNFMCFFLVYLGFEDGVKIFRDTDKWYA